MYELFPYIVFALGLIAGLGSLSVRLLKRMKARRHSAWRRLLFVVPANMVDPFAKHSEGDHVTSTELYKRLHERGIEFGVEAVVRELGEEIYFYLIVRERDKKTVHALVESLWPTGYLSSDENEDFWSGNHDKKEPILGGYFTLERPYAIPLATKVSDEEPFLAFLKKLSGLATVGEGAVLQAMVKEADKHLVEAIGTYLEKLEQGVYTPSKHIHPEFVLTPESTKIIREKITSPLFTVNLRLVAYTAAGDATNLIKRVGDAFTPETKHPHYNHLKLVIPKRQTELIQSLFHYSFDPAQEIVVSANELATYFHLPSPRTRVAKIKR